MSLHDFFNISNTTGVSDDYSYGNDHQPGIPPHIAYIISGFMFVIISLNIPSVLVLFFTKVEQSNFISMHILCLSLTDCGVGMSFFLLVSVTFNYWECWVRFSFFTTMYLGSMIQVVVICLDRVLVLHNLTSEYVTKNSALISKIVLGTFLISMLLTMIPSAAIATPHDPTTCGIEVVFVEKVHMIRVYIGTLFICAECFIICCTATIIRFLWKRKHSTRVKPHTSNAVQTHMDKDIKAIVTLLIIVSIYIVLTTPLNVVTLVSGIVGKSADRKIAVPFAALSCLNSACNPIVYSFRIPEIQTAFKNTWNKIRCR